MNNEGKSNDYSAIFGKSIGIVGISFVIFWVSNILIALILFYFRSTDNIDFIANIIYAIFYFNAILASLLIFRSNFVESDIPSVPFLTSGIVLMINAIMFFVNNQYGISRLIFYPIITFIIVYLFLKLVIKKSEAHDMIIKYLKRTVIWFYPVVFVFSWIIDVIRTEF